MNLLEVTHGDLISRQAAIHLLEEMKELDYELWIRTNGYSHLTEKQWDWLINNFQEQALNEIPTIQSKHKTGRWIQNKHTDTVLCCECGKCYGDEYNYCPNCGAKMEDIK